MPDTEIRLRALHGFHVGGEIVQLNGVPSREIPTIRGRPMRVADPNGSHSVGQMYVQEFLLSEPRSPYLLQFWHGGGLTGACWETTPDGRAGWLDYFLRCGHDVALCDASERGRAGWAPYPEINAEAPWHRTIEMAWSMFRIGPDGGYHRDAKRREAYEGSQFPLAYADQLLKQFVARWGSRQSDRWAVNAYSGYLAKRPESVILSHSQGGLYAFDVAAAAPVPRRGLICVEPVLPPEPDFPFDRLRDAPVLILTGDNMVSVQPHEVFAAAARRAGVHVDLWKLPDMGIRGNSHLIMMDLNSASVAGLVQRWMRNNIA